MMDCLFDLLIGLVELVIDVLTGNNGKKTNQIKKK